MARKVQDILDECIEMLAAGAEIEECLARYHEHREELAPLLTVASRAMAAASSIRYRPEAMVRGLDRLTAAAADRGVPSGRWRRWVQLRPNVPRPVLAGLLTVVVATGMAFGDRRGFVELCARRAALLGQDAEGKHIAVAASVRHGPGHGPCPAGQSSDGGDASTFE